MIDAKALVGTFATAISASTTWLEAAEPIVTMVVTTVVGGVTLWYTVERALVLRKERKNGTDSKRNDSSV